MSAQPEFTQRDPHSRSDQMVDVVQAGQSFTVARDVHRIGEPTPLLRPRRLVPRGEFGSVSCSAPDISLNAFRVDQDRTAAQGMDDPFVR